MTRLNVHLYRDSFNTPWGFRLQGGKDLNQPLTVQRVFSNSPAEGELQRGDNILSINNRDTADLTHKQAQDNIKHGGGQIQLVIYRPPPGTHLAPLSPPIVTPRPRAPSLQSPSYYSPQPSSVQYNQNSSMNGDPYYGYRPDNPSNQPTYKSKPTYLQIQVNPPSHAKQQQQYNQPQNQHQQYYLQQQRQQQQKQPARHRSSFSQPPVTPTTPPPPWAAKQFPPKRVTKLSQLGGAGQTYGTDFSTLPRSSPAQHGATPHRPRPSFEPDEEREPDLPLATGPVPRVCSRRNLGGGRQDFGTSFGQSATLPRRHDAGRRSSQPPASTGGYGTYMPTKVPATRYGGPQQFGTEYSPKSYGQTPAQRVQTTLDNITLSPRTPEAQPIYQPLQQPQQPQQQPQPYYQPQQPPQLSPQYRPQQVYTPTSLLLEQQRLQEQQQQQQQQAAEEVRTPLSHPRPRVPKPQTSGPGAAGNKYSTFGQDYNRSGPQQSNAVWRPAQPSPGAHQSQHQKPYAPGQVAPALTHSAPPPWKRPDNDDDNQGTPAWRSTLKSASGVKPWERDIEYQHQEGLEASPRSVPYHPAPGPQSPAQNAGTPGDGPKVVHLQYNSPMQLYSSQNVADTYASHAQALSPGGDAHKPVSNQAGDRDWSQSAVLRFLNQESKRGGAPPVAPKPPSHQTVVQHSPAPQQNQYNDSIGASDF